MRAAGWAWVSVIVLVVGIALLPGLLYLLGLAWVEGWPTPADRVPSGHAACSDQPRTGRQPMNPWGFTMRFFDAGPPKKQDEVEVEAFWVARQHLDRQPQHATVRRHLSTTALAIWITRHWSAAQIADTASKEDACRSWQKRRVPGGPMKR
ncbi:hypothetical protein [Stenotrophomonas sp.]|uniref:hypothetical protein n=1 Tax=Stenotrophomonas sp. TaxID=69392 RepID=UPI002FCC65AD